MICVGIDIAKDIPTPPFKLIIAMLIIVILLSRRGGGCYCGQFIWSISS